MNKSQAKDQEIIEQILVGMDIQKVISIDDFYSKDNSHYENAVVLFQIARSRHQGEYSEIVPRSILDADEGIWLRLLESFWKETEPSMKLAILDELASVTDYEKLPSDVRDLSLLKGLIPDRFFVALSPSDWERERGKLISEAQDKHRILCLFDQDLSMADLPGRSGMMLIQQILETQKQDCFVICGLLTQTLRKDDEITKAREMAAEFGLHLDQFLPLSKDRLRSDPMDFANRLKMILLNFVREQLSNQVVKLTDQANREAQRQTNEIDVYDFERIVVQSSEQEGIWEPDTLFRLLDIGEKHFNKAEKRPAGSWR